MYQATITNDEINQMPVGHFPGHILVVDSEETMREAETLLQGETLLGYDTETRPSFQKGMKYGMALVQISTADTALLFRIKMAPLSENIRAMLSSPEIIKVGAAIRDDLRGMRQATEFRPAGFVDLQSVVKRWGIEELSVKKMAAIVLGIKVSKAQRLTNWEAVRLTEPQQDYAAMDAWVCREIYLRLRADNAALMDEAEKMSLQQQPEGEMPPKHKTRNRRRTGRSSGMRHHRRSMPAAEPSAAAKVVSNSDSEQIHDKTDTPTR
ncbi:3'-5' exonuclease [uncultured Rikenella sp.]|uniref:3'-5' exonuclease n=1 Tax=uncultured Rikenella sp. TaxID=368003 RepID=UPI0026151599|nr:3'-5' exonuclease [uncultured Rikenella sp.]